MKFKITYWDAGDREVIREVEAEDIEAAINLLANDPQNPLAQVRKIDILDEPTERQTQP